jgi:hypothetical protein
VDGFYDDVRALPPEEREALAALPFDAQGFVASTGSPAAAVSTSLPHPSPWTARTAVSTRTCCPPMGPPR